jgi:hypothetical protein
MRSVDGVQPPGVRHESVLARADADLYQVKRRRAGVDEQA